ncbi:MAG: NADH-ubiquinone oxidoreductase chain 6 [Vampirovibrio sp.]|jgi:hypothetical protein|nr:NADH-ubiquinone oxidoreductase chain 6 [Vampirovibrio sp.]
MHRKAPLHPLFFAAYPVLYLYSVSLDETPFTDILVPLALSLGGVLLIYALLGIIISDKRRAAFVTSLLIFLFFAYGHLLGLHNELKQAYGISINSDKVLLFQGVLVALGCFYAFRAKASLEPVTRFLTFFSIALLVMSGVTVGAYMAGNAAHVSHSKSEEAIKGRLAAVLHGQKPDVYYMIFDAYPRADIIERLLDGSNKSFVDALQRRGFYVAPKSCSNYPRTFLSLSSSLNFKYLNYLEKTYKDKTNDYSVYTDMLKDYDLQRILKQMGYKYVHVGSWSPPFKKNVNADINLVGPADEFPLEFMETTLLSKYWKNDLYYTTLRKHILHSLQQLEEEVPQISGPKFVFSHVISPHPPFHFDHNGNPVSVDPYSKDKVMLKAAFNDQLVYLNHRIIKIIDQILAHSKTPPIIIIQGDHGTPLTGNLTDGWTPSYIQERLSILNAYYLPGNGADNKFNVVYPTITPVNTFRRVLSYYYGMDYTDLPDKQYFIYPRRPYAFYDMSDKADCKVTGH